MATQQEVIKTLMQSLDNSTLNGADAFNEAIKASSNFKSFKAVRTKFLADLKAAKNWHTFLVEKCGIVLYNKDTGAISGADAGGASVKGATDLLPSKGKAIYPEGSEFTINGMTLYGIPPKEMLTKDEQYVVKGLCSWWLRDALALIKESYGLSFDEEGTTNSRIKLKFMDDEEKPLLAYVDFADDGNRYVYEGRVLCVNMAYFKDMNPDDRHGFVEKTGMNLDRTLVHELVHGLMASNVLGLENIPPFFIEGGSAELIHGIDDEREEDIIEYVKYPTVFEEFITADGFPDDPDYEEPEEIYAAGYVFMRYFAKQAGIDTKFDYDTYHKTVSVDSLNFATNYHDTVTMRGSSNADTITNSGYNVSINAGKGNDVIKTYSDTVSVSGGKGNDDIFNEGSYVTILGGSGKDTIKSDGGNVKIDGGTGNDSIQNYGASSIIDGGAGKDTISNYSASVTVDGGAGNDNFLNMSEKVSLFGGAGDDSIWNMSKNVTINGGADNDTIHNQGATSKVYGGADNDSIHNQGASSKIYGGTGNDIILNDTATVMGTVSGSKSTLYGGAGNDSITNAADSVKIYGQDGADFITNSSNRVSIFGGADNDSISNTANRVKIYGQDDADSIDNSGKRVSIFGGASNDYIANSGASVSISGDDGNDFITNSGNLSYISLGAGKDTFQNFADSISADGGSGRNRIINRGDEFTLVGGTGRDTIYNYGEKASLTGGKGNDYIFNSGTSVTSSGGAGDDYIRNEGVQVYILGGAGNDTIRNDSNHVTLSGGKGNDYLRNSGGKHITYRFAKNMGNDTVVGFNSSDTVQIISGKYSASTSGKNVVVKVGASTLTLRNAVGKEINFINSSGKTSTKTYSASRLAKKTSALLADDNFLTSNDLSALVKEKNVETSYVAGLALNVKELGMKNNLVTYSGSKK